MSTSLYWRKIKPTKSNYIAQHLKEVFRDADLLNRALEVEDLSTLKGICACQQDDEVQAAIEKLMKFIQEGGEAEAFIE